MPIERRLVQVNRIRIGIFKGSVKQLRQDLETCRQLGISLLELAKLRKENRELFFNRRRIANVQIR